jgi:hypothetical protein
MAYHGRDDIDIAAESWAFQWVRHFGRDPQTAAATLGPLKCTIGRVRELGDGASSFSGYRSQTWPEVFLGTALAVNLAFQTMSLPNRAVLFAHYVLRWYDAGTWARRSRPTKQSTIAGELGIGVAEYYTRRDCAKECIRTVLDLHRGEARRMSPAPTADSLLTPESTSWPVSATCV